MDQEKQPRTAEPQTAEPIEGQAQTQAPAAQAPAGNVREQRRIVLRFLLKLAVVVLVLWALFTFVFGIRLNNGNAMYPSLRDGDLMLFYRLEQTYHIDDVVAFQEDGDNRVARIVAQGGDVVELNEYGQLVVNGNIQTEEVFNATVADEWGVSYAYTVPEDSYFVLCDLRTNCIDSRTFGAISRKDLDGKVITILRRRDI
jgi:signal peptidase I